MMAILAWEASSWPARMISRSMRRCDAESGRVSNTIFDDEKPEEIDTLPDSASHRRIDLEIIRAGQELSFGGVGKQSCSAIVDVDCFSSLRCSFSDAIDNCLNQPLQIMPI
jgi:hypothetical protein